MLRSFAPDVALCADPRTVFVASVFKKLLRLRTKVVSWLHFALDRLSHTKFLRVADAHFAVSTGVARDLYARGLDAVYVVYNPVVRPLRMHPRSEVAVFLHLGRITLGGQKRTDDFLRAMAGLRGRYRAAVVGGGPDEGKLKDLAEELGPFRQDRLVRLAGSPMGRGAGSQRLGHDFRVRGVCGGAGRGDNSGTAGN